jgi:hypothetical protein
MIVSGLRALGSEQAFVVSRQSLLVSRQQEQIVRGLRKNGLASGLVRGCVPIPLLANEARSGAPQKHSRQSLLVSCQQEPILDDARKRRAADAFGLRDRPAVDLPPCPA